MTVHPATPAAPGAVAILEVRGDVERACRALTPLAAPPAIGEVRLRNCAEIDTALVARPALDHLLIMPHGGPALVRALRDVLIAAGFDLAPDACGVTTDAACRDALLPFVTAPMAIAPLIDRPERFRALFDCSADAERRRALGHLLHPPLVVLAGAANIGKSTLANALAGRRVARTAAEPGTTRDAVGALIDLSGLVVRWLDTPGLREATDPVESAAIELARGRLVEADFLIAAADARSAWPELPREPDLRLGLAADRGRRTDVDLSTSARTGEGLRELALRVRDCLVPPAMLG